MTNEPEKTEAKEIDHILDSVINEYTAGEYANWAKPMMQEDATVAIQRLLDGSKLKMLENIEHEIDSMDKRNANIVTYRYAILSLISELKENIENNT